MMVSNCTNSEDSLKEALEAYKNGTTESDVAVRYGIPKATLRDMLMRQTNFPALTILLPEEEMDIVNWLKEVIAVGYVPTKRELYETIKAYLDYNGRKTRWNDNRPGRTWLQLFCKRHPDISIDIFEDESNAKAKTSATEQKLDSSKTKVLPIDPPAFTPPHPPAFSYPPSKVLPSRPTLHSNSTIPLGSSTLSSQPRISIYSRVPLVPNTLPIRPTLPSNSTVPLVSSTQPSRPTININSTVKPFTPAPNTPCSSTAESAEAILRKLIILTSQLKEKTTLSFLKRIEEGYNFVGVDPLYDLWKNYFNSLCTPPPAKTQKKRVAVSTLKNKCKKQKITDAVIGEYSGLKQAETKDAGRNVKMAKEVEEKQACQNKQKVKKKKKKAKKKKKENEKENGGLNEKKLLKAKIKSKS